MQRMENSRDTYRLRTDSLWAAYCWLRTFEHVETHVHMRARGHVEVSVTTHLHLEDLRERLQAVRGLLATEVFLMMRSSLAHHAEYVEQNP